MKRRHLKDKLYLYTNREIPHKLLETLIQSLTSFNSAYTDRSGRLGVMGVTKDMSETFGYKHHEMLNEDKCVKVGTKCFSKILNVIRMAFPSATLDEWYLFTISCYYANFDKIKTILSKNGINGWLDFKKNHRYGTEFAEKVWKKFKDNGGIVT